MAHRTCEVCADPLPLSATARRRFCSIKCKNRAHIPLRVACNRKWRRGNPHLVRAWRQSYRQRQAEIMQRYYRENPGIFRELRHQRRARMAAATAIGVSDRDWARLVQRHGERCAYCGADGDLTVDHIVPISRGGAHSIGNVLPACRTCNTSKGAKLLVEWRRSRPAE